MKDGYYRIKTWETMEEEYGVDMDGDIDCPFMFTTDMEKAMPKDRIIEVIFGVWDDWCISEAMVSEYLGRGKSMSAEPKTKKIPEIQEYCNRYGVDVKWKAMVWMYRDLENEVGWDVLPTHVIKYWPEWEGNEEDSLHEPEGENK